MTQLFDLNKYLIPLWEGNIVYDESVMAVREQDGSLSLQALAYEAKRYLP
jgi:hypothetical protein